MPVTHPHPTPNLSPVALSCDCWLPFLWVLEGQGLWIPDALSYKSQVDQSIPFSLVTECVPKQNYRMSQRKSWRRRGLSWLLASEVSVHGCLDYCLGSGMRQSIMVAGTCGERSCWPYGSQEAERTDGEPALGLPPPGFLPCSSLVCWVLLPAFTSLAPPPTLLSAYS